MQNEITIDQLQDGANFYSAEFDGKITAEKLFQQAVAELNELLDYYSNRGGWQMHRSAVCGKKLHAVVHGRDIFNQSDFPWRCEVRVDGQYTGHATTYLATRADAEMLRDDFNTKYCIVGINK